MVNRSPTVSAFARSYNSFSGLDMRATFGHAIIGELQGVSYSITREKAPIYTMGSADPRAFSRGKRGIAGTLIFIMFDRHALLEEMRVAGVTFQADKDDIRPLFRRDNSDPLNLSLTSSSTRLSSTPVGGAGVGISAVRQARQESTSPAGDAGSDQEQALPWYSDQIPPFDITLSAANEYGALAVMRIFGVEILNEGYGISIDDLVSEQQMTYVARTILPWQYINNDQTVQSNLSPSGA
jgi:hypothetical protein